MTKSSNMASTVIISKISKSLSAGKAVKKASDKLTAFTNQVGEAVARRSGEFLTTSTTTSSSSDGKSDEAAAIQQWRVAKRIGTLPLARLNCLFGIVSLDPKVQPLETTIHAVADSQSSDVTVLFVMNMRSGEDFCAAHKNNAREVSQMAAQENVALAGIVGTSRTSDVTNNQALIKFCSKHFRAPLYHDERSRLYKLMTSSARRSTSGWAKSLPLAFSTKTSTPSHTDPATGKAISSRVSAAAGPAGGVRPSELVLVFDCNGKLRHTHRPGDGADNTMDVRAIREAILDVRLNVYDSDEDDYDESSVSSSWGGGGWDLPMPPQSTRVSCSAAATSLRSSASSASANWHYK